MHLLKPCTIRAIISFCMLACIFRFTVQVEHIRVKWLDNELFLTDGSELTLNVGTTGVLLVCSISAEYVSWNTPDGDRINASTVNGAMLAISIFRLAESGVYSCVHNNTFLTINVRLHAYGTALFEIDSKGVDRLIRHGHSVFEPVNSHSYFICLSSFPNPFSANWYYPSGARIENKVHSTDDPTTDIAVFSALPHIGVYQLRLSGFFDEEEEGIYSCRVKNTLAQVVRRELGVYLDYRGHIKVEWRHYSIQLIHNNTIDVPIGTVNIKLDCTFPSGIWIYPATSHGEFISIRNSTLNVSLFTIGESGYYTCITNDNHNITIRLQHIDGINLVASDNHSFWRLSNFSAVQYTPRYLALYCLSSVNILISTADWVHPLFGVIKERIVQENGVIMTVRDMNRGVHALIFTGALSERDIGLYSCSIFDSHLIRTRISVGVNRIKHVFSVYSYPDINIQAVSHQTVMLMAGRESITIKCESNNNNNDDDNDDDNVQWTLPRTSSASILDDNRVYIAVLSVLDEGYYTCHTSNQTASLLLIRYSHSLVTSVHGEVYSVNSTLTIFPCDPPIEVSCYVMSSSLPIPLIWTRNYATLIAQTDSNVGGVAKFGTSFLRSKDSGQFKCSTNTLGLSITTRINIVILEANYIQVQYDDKRLLLSDGQQLSLNRLARNVSLICIGNQVQWVRLASKAAPGDTTQSASYLIHQLTTDEAGEYECHDNLTVSNTIITLSINSGTDSNMTQNTLQLYQSSLKVPIDTPYIHINTAGDYMHDVINNSYPLLSYGTIGATLKCSLSGDIFWEYINSNHSAGQVCLVRDQELLVRRIDEYTRGTYICANEFHSIRIYFAPIIAVSVGAKIIYTGSAPGILYFPINTSNIRLSCDSPIPNWNVYVPSINSTIDTSQLNNTSYAGNITTSDNDVVIGKLGLLESGDFTCGTTTKSLIALQSSVSITVKLDERVYKVFIRHNNLLSLHINAERVLISCNTITLQVVWRDIPASKYIVPVSSSMFSIARLLHHPTLTFSCHDPGYAEAGVTSLNINTFGISLYTITANGTLNKVANNTVLIVGPPRTNSTLILLCIYGSETPPPQWTHKIYNVEPVTYNNSNANNRIPLRNVALILNSSIPAVSDVLGFNGEYRCVDSQQSEFISITVYYASTVIPSVSFYRNGVLVRDSYIVRTPLNTTNDTLECRVTLTEPTIANNTLIRWIDTSSRVVYYPYLRLRDISPNKSGTYICEAHSLYYSTTRSVTIQSLNGKPENVTIIKLPAFDIIEEGDDVILICSADTPLYDTLTYTWLDSNAAHISTGPLLEFRNISRYDSGAYTCVATNTYTYSNATSYIQIYYIYQPIVVGNTSAVFGSPIHLTCSIDSYPLIDFEGSNIWHRDGQPLNLTNVRIITPYMISIPESNFEDTGNYTCSAYNPVLNRTITSSPAAIIIKGAPDALLNTSIVILAARWLLINAEVGFNGNSESLSFIVHINSFPYTEVTFLPYNITELQPDMEYTISLIAVNEFGSSGPVYINITTNEEVPSAPRNITLSQITSTSALLNWMDPSNTFGIIIGYFLEVYKFYETGWFYRLVISHTLNNTMLHLSDLLPYTTYLVLIRAYNGAGYGHYADDVSFVTLQAAPSHPPRNVTVIALSSTELSITWKAPEREFWNGIPTKFAVTISKHADTNYSTNTVLLKIIYIADSNLDDYYHHSDNYDHNKKNIDDVISFHELFGLLNTIISGLDANTNYYISVKMYTKAGASTPSRPVIFKTPQNVPDAVEKFTYTTLTQTRVLIFWQLHPSYNRNHLGFQISYFGFKTYDPIYEESGNLITLPAGLHSYSIEYLTPATNYNISIRVITALGLSNVSTILLVKTKPGVVNVISPIVPEMLQFGLNSVIIRLRQPSNRNANIVYHFLIMVKLPSTYDTRGFNIHNYLTDNRTETKLAFSDMNIIQILLIANISKSTCIDFPHLYTVGNKPDSSIICDFSALLQNSQQPLNGGVIKIDYYPDLEFGYKYAFLLAAITQENLIFYSLLSDFVEIKDSPYSLFLFTPVIYIGVAIIAVIICLICTMICSYSLFYFCSWYNATRNKNIILTGHQLLSFSNEALIMFSNQTVETSNLKDYTSEAFNPLEELAQHSEMFDSSFSLEELGEHVEFLHQNSNAGFLLEYESLNDRDPSEATVAKIQDNATRNRYVDVFPYDDSRVVLTPIPNYPEFEHNYINASFINGYFKERAFIACQDPVLNTAGDIWRLSWHYNISLFITFINRDLAKNRGTIFWPETEKLFKMFGAFTISLIDTNTYQTFTRKSFKLKNSEYPDDNRIVHLFYLTSCDSIDGVPELSTFINFHSYVNSFHSSLGNTGPILVQCSSGSGLSAVFLAFDILFKQGSNESKVNIQACIRSMRNSRSKMFCSLNYYVFLHDLLMTALYCKTTYIDALSFSSFYEQITSTDSQSMLENIDKQYSVLGQISLISEDYPTEAALNIHRNYESIPNDSTVFQLSDYECEKASFVKGYYRDRDSFIIVESPLRQTQEYFWQMIFKYRCPAIVMLCQAHTTSNDICVKYWVDSGEPMTFGDLTVQLSNIMHPEHAAYTVQSFSITSSKIKGLYLDVKQYIYHQWCREREDIPANYDNFAKLVKQVVNLHMANEDDERPILVHCRDAVNMSGVFCSAALCIERILSENAVDVFQCVKDLRTRKPGLVNSEIHYKAIYKTILAFVENY